MFVIVLMLTGCGVSVEPPRFTEPARTVEEIARRLREFELRGQAPFPRAGDVFHLCLNASDPEAPAEPQAVPTVVAQVRTDPPVHVRFMLMPGAARAARLVARAAAVARGCAGPAVVGMGEGLRGQASVSAFDRGG
ncbi:hypothetical protein [Planobispora longispora]|nr:hypothetical protein [Planobispora longispora]